jgi:hypothetical protein
MTGMTRVGGHAPPPPLSAAATPAGAARILQIIACEFRRQIRYKRRQAQLAFLDEQRRTGPGVHAAQPGPAARGGGPALPLCSVYGVAAAAFVDHPSAPALPPWLLKVQACSLRSPNLRFERGGWGWRRVARGGGGALQTCASTHWMLLRGLAVPCLLMAV